MATTDEPIKVEQAVQFLSQAIAAGEYKPGERLRQTQIARQLGLSSTPIREALRRLQAEGLVIHTPRRGVRVSSASIEDIRETYQLLGVLEGLAARLLAARARRGSAKRELDTLERTLQGSAEPCQGQEWSFPDNAFHIALDAACPAPHLRRLLRSLWVAIPRDPLGRQQGRTERSAPDHAAIFEAIRAGHGARAERLIRRHFVWVSRRRVEFLKSVRAELGSRAASRRRAGMAGRAQPSATAWTLRGSG